MLSSPLREVYDLGHVLDILQLVESAYEGFYRKVCQHAKSILPELMNEIGFLCWSLGLSWELGMGPLPIQGSAIPRSDFEMAAIVWNP